MTCKLHDGVCEFPKSLACVLQDGYTTTRDDDIVGYGGRRIQGRANASFTVMFQSNTDMAIFTDWYFNEIDRGVKPFTILLPIFGVKKYWTVEIMNNLNESDFKGGTRICKIDVRVLDDIAKIIDDEAGKALCESC